MERWLTAVWLLTAVESEAALLCEPRLCERAEVLVSV